MIALMLALATVEPPRPKPHWVGADPNVYHVEWFVDRTGVVGSMVYLFMDKNVMAAIDVDEAPVFVNGARWRGKDSWSLKNKVLSPGRWWVRLTKSRLSEDKILKAEFFGG